MASFGAKLVFRIVSSLQKGCGKSSQHHSTSFEKKCGENQDSLMTLQNGCGVKKKRLPTSQNIEFDLQFFLQIRDVPNFPQQTPAISLKKTHPSQTSRMVKLGCYQSRLPNLVKRQKKNNKQRPSNGAAWNSGLVETPIKNSRGHEKITGVCRNWRYSSGRMVVHWSDSAFWVACFCMLIRYFVNLDET